MVPHGKEGKAAGVWHGWAHDIHNQETEEDGCMFLLRSLFSSYIVQDPSQGMMPPAVGKCFQSN